jgi:hypothetical protein
MRRLHRKRDGILLIEEADGSARYLTWWESILYWIGLLK